MNDTWSRGDWRDSYPYSSISVYALHPIYLELRQLTTDADILKSIDAKATELNKLQKIDYEVKIKSQRKSNFLGCFIFQNGHFKKNLCQRKIQVCSKQ